MTEKDQQKIIDAGFMIIRRDYENLKIKFKDKLHLHWKNSIDNFKNKNQLDKKAREFSENRFIVED